MSLIEIILGLPTTMFVLLAVFLVFYIFGLTFGTFDIIDSRQRKYGGLRKHDQTGFEAAVEVLKWPLLWPLYVPILIGRNMPKLWQRR
uniref:Hypothetical membrane protein n=1 Tax=uncultured virus TaxID=340016 RepID=D5L2F4_9VIRU|nr:hypothetical membrane protein [uncultured virus]